MAFRRGLVCEKNVRGLVSGIATDIRKNKHTKPCIRHSNRVAVEIPCMSIYCHILTNTTPWASCYNIFFQLNCILYTPRPYSTS